YCAGGNTRLAKIAIEEGFLYGSRSDDARNLRCNGLIDIEWNNYNWVNHVDTVKKHKPKYAVVPDVINANCLEKYIKMAEEIEDFCERTILVPKVRNIISIIPKKYVIGVSVPTSYAGFLPNVIDMKDHDIHLLGGTPKQQKELWLYYKRMGCNIISSDSNSHNKASDFGSYWNGFYWCDRERTNIGKYLAFRKSCQGIVRMWKYLGAI
ncbi:MAG: DUF6610 family protein, partial [Chloroflexota bacterium]|nr:DUF6610 family protein [Chloroflexota bacterium]